MFNLTWLCKYLPTIEIVFDNIYYCNRLFVPLLKYSSIKPSCIAIKNPQGNALMDQVH